MAPDATHQRAAIALTALQFVGWEAADPQKAAHLLHDLHPWHSLALLHAAIAGVYLFLSGLIAGYYDNQALYHRIPQRLRRTKWLRTLLGPARLAESGLRQCSCWSATGRAIERQAGELHARLHFGRTEDIIRFGLHEYLMEFLDRIADLGAEVHRRFFARAN